MLPENKKEKVKDRVKSQVLKHWNKTLEEILPNDKDRLELYQQVWNIREKTFFGASIPKAKLQQVLIENLGHWDTEHHKGMKMPAKINDIEDNQGLHSISSR